jgi:hypothetical protein
LWTLRVGLAGTVFLLCGLIFNTPLKDVVDVHTGGDELRSLFPHASRQPCIILVYKKQGAEVDNAPLSAFSSVFIFPDCSELADQPGIERPSLLRGGFWNPNPQHCDPPPSERLERPFGDQLRNGIDRDPLQWHLTI